MTDPSHDKNRAPQAIRIDPAPKSVSEKERKPRAFSAVKNIELTPDEAANEREVARLPDMPPPQKRFSWLSLFSVAIGALLSMALWLWIDSFVREMFARHEWLGWAALAAAVLAGLALLAILVREFAAMARLAEIGSIRKLAADAHAGDNIALARKAAREIARVTASSPSAARGRKRLAEFDNDIVDGRDLITLAEREILAPLDDKALELVANAAKRVSVVTAVSPRAIVDVAYVAIENLRLIGALSALYGGRPGTLGFLRLTRNVIGHLAATGAIAFGDSLVQQLVGQGLAARLSARLGEGVVNGLLTARIGLSAMDMCRPAPFISIKRPGMSRFVTMLASFSGASQDKKPSSENGNGA